MREIERKGNKSVVVVVVASPPTPSYPSQSWRKFFFFSIIITCILDVFFPREVLANAVILFQRRPPSYSTPVLDLSCFCFPPAHFVVVVAAVVLVAFFVFSVPIRL
jgi:hypothetical protein